MTLGKNEFFFLLPDFGCLTTVPLNFAPTCYFQLIRINDDSAKCISHYESNIAEDNEEDVDCQTVPISSSPIEQEQVDDGEKPTKSYSMLITEAIRSTLEKRITLNGIYEYLISKYLYFQTTSVDWQNSIRHNLSLNKSFVRIPRKPDEPGKGMYWGLSHSVKGRQQVLPPQSKPEKKKTSRTRESRKSRARRQAIQTQNYIRNVLNLNSFSNRHPLNPSTFNLHNSK